ncbi:conserved hypothetical protein [Rhodospirillaceae bacterium LM-1]|nr:conserved hypothetical protein [Rhodospirillaceae bacterium LM-1]
MSGVSSKSSKPLVWIKDSRSRLQDFPEKVRDVMGFALFQAQLGGKHISAKPLKGFGGAGVLEVVDDFDTDTFRAVYTVKLAGVVYVLHCFQKKAKHGIATPKAVLDLIHERLKLAEQIHKDRGQ